MGLGFLNPTSLLGQADIIAFVCSKETKRIDNKISERGGATLV